MRKFLAGIISGLILITTTGCGQFAVVSSSTPTLTATQNPSTPIACKALENLVTDNGKVAAKELDKIQAIRNNATDPQLQQLIDDYIAKVEAHKKAIAEGYTPDNMTKFNIDLGNSAQALSAYCVAHLY